MCSYLNLLMRSITITDIWAIYKHELCSQQITGVVNHGTTSTAPVDNSSSLLRKSRSVFKINKTIKFNPLWANFLPGILIIICLRDFQGFITICLILTLERVLILDFLLIFTKNLTYLVALMVISRLTKTLNGIKRT